MALTDNILAYWKFNETNGTRYDTIDGLQITETNGIINSSQGIWGNAANITSGNSEWLTLPAGICDVGSGEKSFSLWFKIQQNNVGYQWLLMQGSGHDYDELNVVYIENNNTLNYLFMTDTNSYWAGNIDNIIPTVDVWHHYVLTLGNGIATAYYDGVQVSQVGYSGSIKFSNSQYTLGHYTGINNIGGLTGQIDELGIWSRTLTPEEVVALYNDGNGLTFPFVLKNKSFLKIKGDVVTNNNNTSLLLHFNGYNGSTDIVDTSANSNIITVLGNAQIDSDASVFGGSSLRLTDTNSYLQYTNTDKFTFDGDFCIECFVYINSSGTRVVVENRTNLAAYQDFVMYITTNFQGAGNNGVGFVTDNIFRVDAASTTVPLQTWTHIAVTRENGVFRIFTNGVQDSATGTNANIITPSAAVASLGGSSDYANFDGYIDEFRITKGSAVYTADFTPPTSPFSNGKSPAFIKFKNSLGGIYDIPEPIAYWNLNDNGSGNVNLNDSTNNSNILINHNNVALESAGKRNGCAFLDNTNYLYNDNIRLAGNFTISLWVNPAAQTSTYPTPICLDSSNNIGSLYIFESVNPSGFRFITTTFENCLTQNTWNHFVFSYDNGTTTIYLNNNLMGTDTNVFGISSVLSLGTAVNGYIDTSYFTGLIDEVGIWNQSLTQEHVTKLYNNTNGITYPFSRNTLPAFLKFK